MAAPPPGPPGGGQLRLVVYALSFLFIGSGMALAGAELEWLAERVGARTAELWQMYAARGMAYCVSSLLGGVAGDLLGDRGAHGLMGVSMLAAGLGAYAMDFVATTPSQLALASTGVSAAMGVFDTVGNMAILRGAADGSQSSDMSVAHAAFGMGCFAAPAALPTFLGGGRLVSFGKVSAACAILGTTLLCLPGGTLRGGDLDVAAAKGGKRPVRLDLAVAACATVLVYVGAEQGAGALLATVGHLSFGLSSAASLRLTSTLWLALFVGRVASAKLLGGGGEQKKDDDAADRLVLVVSFVAAAAGLGLAGATVGGGHLVLFPLVFLLGAAYGPVYPVAFARMESKLHFSATFGGILVATGGIGEMILPPVLFFAWHQGQQVTQRRGGLAFAATLAALSLLYALAWAFILARTSPAEDAAAAAPATTQKRPPTASYDRVPTADIEMVAQRR
mmetsp:Transcript_22718/g.73057  ORF Transcript_22718/g.73057 Transcript_22718/m.73057 type:complete len:450 (-) Transcript_22718:121-1470(-)